MICSGFDFGKVLVPVPAPVPAPAPTSLSGSGSRQYFSQFSKYKKIAKELAISMPEAAYFPKS
jgi:hypothetical protein